MYKKKLLYILLLYMNTNTNKSRKYNLSFILSEIIGSENPKNYLRKIKGRVYKNGLHQIEENDLIIFLEKSKKVKAKEYLEKIKQGGLIDGLILSEDEKEKNELDNKMKNLENIIKNISYQKDSNINYFIDNDKIYFKGRDIAKILEYSDLEQSIKKNVDDDDKIVINEKLGIIYKSMEEFSKYQPPLLSDGGDGTKDVILFKENRLNSESFNTIFINESGLYSLILRSNKKEALSFKKWITSEILPSIRKTGSYNIFDYTPYLNKNVFYLFRVKEKIYKYGITKNIKNRFMAHKINKLLLSESNIIKIYVLENYNIIMDIENIFFKYLKNNNLNVEYKNGKEFLETNNINSIVNELDNLIFKYNNNKIMIEENEIANKNIYLLQLQNENLKLSLKLKETDDNKLLKLKEIEENKMLKLKELESNIKLKELELEILKEKNKNKMLDTEVIIKLKTKKCLDCDNLISNKSTRCNICVYKNRLINSIEKTNRPNYNQLINDIKELKSLIKVGEKYNVSDNTIRKWIRKYENHELINS